MGEQVDAKMKTLFAEAWRERLCPGHIKNMTEIFEQLSFIGDTVTDEDRLVFLLASLPDSYRMLVTALEANSDVPKWK